MPSGSRAIHGYVAFSGNIPHRATRQQVKTPQASLSYFNKKTDGYFSLFFQLITLQKKRICFNYPHIFIIINYKAHKFIPMDYFFAPNL